MASNRITVNLDGRTTLGQRVLGTFFRNYGLRLEDAIDEGARTGMNDVLDEWKREATGLAPLEKGTLRRSIKTKMAGKGKDITGEISASVIESKGGRRFDYAAYLHDIYPTKHGDSFANPSTPGTIPRFIATPLEEHASDWVADVEREVKASLVRRGFRAR